MKHNLIPSLIIAIAIVFVGTQFKRTSPVKTFLTDLEAAVQVKDADGKTSLNRIFEGLSSTAAASLQQGFSAGQNEKDKAELAVREKLLVKDVKIVDGSQKNQERVIGLVRNESDKTVTNVRFNTRFKDASGSLIDVNATFTQLQGTLKPGDELGFEIRRDLGNFREDESVLASRKAASAEVSIVDLRIVD
jgi:hypothetical protein